MTRIKVLMVEHFGGENLYSYCLCKALCSHEVDLTVITTTSFPEANGSFKVLRFYPAFEKCHKAVKIFRYISALVKTLGIILSGKFDVIHFQSFRRQNYEWIMFMLISLVRRNTVFTCHNVFPHEYTRYRSIIFKQVYHSAVRIIVHNTYAYESLRKVLKRKRDKEKVFIVPHGNYEHYLKIANLYVDSFMTDRQIQSDPKSSVLNNSESLKLIVFGTMREYKGLDILLEALGYIRNTKVNLLVYGRADRQYREKHENLIINLRIEDKVKFYWGEVPNEKVASTIAAADIVVFPYRKIYQSGALMLAYTLGKPVMVSPIEGFKEDVIPGVNGYVVDFRDNEEFLNLIEYLIINKQELMKIGRFNRYLSETKYNWEYIAAQTLEVYKGVDVLK